MASANTHHVSHNSGLGRDKALPSVPSSPTMFSFSSPASPYHPQNALGLGIPPNNELDFVPPPPPPPRPNRPSTHSPSQSISHSQVPPPPPLPIPQPYYHPNSHSRSSSVASHQRFGSREAAPYIPASNVSSFGGPISHPRSPDVYYGRPPILAPPPPPPPRTPGPPRPPSVPQGNNQYQPIHNSSFPNQSNLPVQFNNATLHSIPPPVPTFGNLSAHFRPVPAPPAHHAYTYPQSSHPNLTLFPPSPTNFHPPHPGMMLAGLRTPSPFDLGPFPASSIPRNHTAVPPPPRPPKPPELSQQTDGTPSSSSLTASGTSSEGAQISPRHTQEKRVSETKDGNEVVNASSSNSGPTSNSNPPSVLGDRPPTNTRVFSHGISPVDHSEIEAPGVDINTLFSSRDVLSSSPQRITDSSDSQPSTSAVMNDVIVDRDTRRESEIDHNTHEDADVDDDVRSDGGMTMEAYDPAAFDFPRNVNQAMVQVLSPTVPAIDEEQPASTPIAPVHASRGSEPDIEAPPPTYDQVTSEMNNERQREDQSHAAPALSIDPLRVRSPPPAFEPEVLSTPTTARPPHMRSYSAVPTRPILPIPGELSYSSGSIYQPERPNSTPSSPTAFVHPSIVTSPPTPEPRSSPLNRLQSLRNALPRRLTVSSTSSHESESTSDADQANPFHDPPSFQAGASPFAATNNQNGSQSDIVSPISPYSETTPARGSPVDTSSFSKNRSNSGIWSNYSDTPSTSRGENPADDDHRRPDDKGKNKRNSTIGKSRMSMFLRGPSSLSAATSTSGTAKEMSPTKGTEHNTIKRPHEGKRSEMDLLGDEFGVGGWPGSTVGSTGYSETDWESQVQPSPGGFGDQEDALHGQSIDLWEGIEFGFGAPKWTTPPAPGPFSNPVDWNDNITLYPLGSNPFFIRAPTWRSLLRFLASQSSTRVEPSVEALATSRTPTIDLRLVVQFVRNPYTPRGTTRDICLYMTLHTEMPSSASKQGRALRFVDRQLLESWDTHTLPYGFICADGSLLSRSQKQPASQYRHILTPPDPQAAGTPVPEQEPDGDDSMFVTLPPPFIELPVKLSDVAMYLHECLVMSRKNGKGQIDFGSGGRGNGGDKSPVGPLGPGKIRKPNASNTNLPAQPQEQLEGPSISHAQTVNAKNIPGMKRLAKAVKTFYPDEYAIGSSKANQAAAHAAVDGTSAVKGKMQTVANTNHHGGSGKSGFFGAFQKMRSKSVIAKQAVGGVGLGGGRDPNAERYELVTPWRQTND